MMINDLGQYFGNAQWEVGLEFRFYAPKARRCWEDGHNRIIKNMICVKEEDLAWQLGIWLWWYGGDFVTAVSAKNNYLQLGY